MAACRIDLPQKKSGMKKSRQPPEIPAMAPYAAV
jgi:hypothetical protein